MLVDADEPERALKLLTDCLPAYYRDNPPIGLVCIRNMIQAALMTPVAYLDCADDSLFCDDPERAKQILNGTLRGQLTKQAVQSYDKPHIIEVGPGEYWLPIGLQAEFCHFTYFDVGVNEFTKAKSKDIVRTEWDGLAPVIFCAQEIIEHLANPSDLAVELMRATNGAGASEIHLSTPLYTYDGKPKPIVELKRNGLPHLRAYTPQEFIAEAMKVFGPMYQWQFHPGQVMSLVGKRK
jgi:hypothetical protein